MRRASCIRMIGVVCVATSLLAGCGFHLRNTPSLAQQVGEIRLDSVGPYGDLMRKIQRQLDIMGVTTGEGDVADEWSLVILSEKNTRRAVTTTSLITVAEYELQLQVEFQLARGDGDLAIPPTPLTARRIYVLDRTSLAGSSEEEEVLKGEMQDELVEAILRRVAAVTAQAEPSVES